MTEYIVDFGGNPAVGIAMAKQHGADVRGEIVRCRDCSKADYSEVHMFDNTRPRVWTCTRFGGFHFMTEPCNYCAWAERRVDE